MKRIMYLVLLATFAISITSVVFARPLPPISSTEMLERLQMLDYQPLGPEKIEESETNYFLGCLQTAAKIPVVDPLTGVKRMVSVLVHTPEVANPKPMPVVIVLPTIEGTQIIEEKVANTICARKMVAIIANVIDTSPPQQLPGWDQERRSFRFGVLAVRTIIDWTERDERMLKGHVGVFGTSMGAILASMVAGVDLRVKATMVGVGGGNIPAILTNTEQEHVAQIREERMRFIGDHDLTRYEDKMREVLQFDPIHFASRVKSDSVFMVMGLNDTRVPYENQKELFEAFGEPKNLIYNSSSHKWSVIRIVYLNLGQILNWMEPKLRAP